MESAGRPDIAGLAPWLMPAENVSAETGQPVGVLEKWGKKWTYVVPHTGDTFKVKGEGLITNR